MTIKKSMKNNRKEVLISLKDLTIASIKLVGALALLALAIKYLLS